MNEQVLCGNIPKQFLILKFKHFKSAYSYFPFFVNCIIIATIRAVLVLVRSTKLGFVPGILRLEIDYYYDQKWFCSLPYFNIEPFIPHKNSHAKL